MITKNTNKKIISTNEPLEFIDKNVDLIDALKETFKKLEDLKQNGNDITYFSFAFSDNHNSRYSRTIYTSRLETDKEYNYRIEQENERKLAAQLSSLKKYEKLRTDLEKLEKKLAIKKNE